MFDWLRKLLRKKKAETEDIRIRKVKVLQGRAKDEAEKKGLKPDDLAIVRTSINSSSLPEYHVEKIDGDPVSFLLKEQPMCDFRKEMRNRTIAEKNQERQKSTLGYGLKSRNFRPRSASEKKLWHLEKKPPKKLEED